MGKASAPPAPNYAPIAAADAAAAEKSFQLGQDQLDWAKSQFNDVWPYAQAHLDATLKTEQNEYNRGVSAYDTYRETYLPIEQKLSNEAKAYNTPERMDANAARAMADVSAAFEASRTNALAQLESYGIDPSETRFGALDLGTRVQQAAATAAAGTQSRLNTEATGLALEGEAINTGRGYPASIAQAYSTAAGAGKSGLGGANETFQTGAYAMGNPTSYIGQGNVALGNQANALNFGYNNALAGKQFEAQQSANMWGGVGKLIGGGIALAGML